jgi:C1q domain
MASIILAGTTTGTALSLTSDTSGELQIQTNNGATTALTLTTGGAAVFTAGTVSDPAITTTGDTNTGIFFPAADTIAFSEGGAEVARFNADAQFVAAAGTALLPVITTTGDVNTGIFFPTADTIAFTEGGVESMRIDSSGNVGIGTSSPLGKLKVTVGDVAPAASGNMNTGVIYETASSSRAINFGVNNTAGYSWINAAFSNNSGVADNLVLMTGTTERMRISSAGVVTMPFQPSFVASRSGDYTYSDQNVAVWNATSINVGTHYNTSNGLFTAPVSGMYSFTASVFLNITAGQAWYVVNGVRGVSISVSAAVIIVGSVVVYLNANDTFGIAIFANTPTYTFIANSNHSYFAGTLIG